MITYPGIKLGVFNRPDERQQLQTVDNMLRQISAALSRSVFPGTQPAANPVSPSPPGGTPGLPQPTQGDTLYGLLTGTYARLAIGSAGTILTSNGGVPYWATVLSLLPTHDHSNTANGGNIPESSVTNLVSDLAAKAPSSHGASNHTDRTRRVSFSAGAFLTNTKGLIGTAPNQAAKFDMPITVVTRSYLMFRVPMDYASTPVFNLYCAPFSTDGNAINWNLYTKVLTPGTTVATAAYDNLDAFTNDSPPGVAEKLYVPTASISTTLAAGDIVRFTVERDGIDGNLDVQYVLGGDFTYTADM